MLKKIKRIKKEEEKTTSANSLDESREKVLAKGRKFKYPFQYSKHKMIINTILIAIAALGLLLVFGWFELYKVQDTSSVAFRFTKVLNLPVASVDGVNIRYSDYLMIYRSSINTLEYQQGKLDDSEDSQMLRQHYKRQALNSAEEYGWALAKLNEAGESVTEEELNDLVSYHMQINGQSRSPEAFEAIITKSFGLSMTEYRRLLKLRLARKKYSELYDSRANKLAQKAKDALKSGSDLKAIAASLGDTEVVSYEKTDDFMSDATLDGGRAIKAKGLKAGEVSEMFTSRKGDCYYFVKLIEEKDGKVKYESLEIRFTEFDKTFVEIKNSDKIKEYIEVSDGTSGEEIDLNPEIK